jgi:hypothetical protein
MSRGTFPYPRTLLRGLHNSEGPEMKSSKLLAMAAGLAALAACGGNTDEYNADNVDANAMTVDNTMAPADNVTIDANSVTVIDNNMAAPADANMTTNATDNTTNSY